MNKPGFLQTNLSLAILTAAILALIMLTFGHPLPPPYNVFSLNVPSSDELGPVSFQNFTPKVILFLCMNYAIVALFGYSLALPFFAGEPRQPLAMEISASFFIGYLCSIGLLRPLTFLIPYQDIYLPGIIFIAALTAFFLWVYRWDLRRPPEPDGKKKWGRISWFLFLAMAVAFITSILLLQINEGDFHWVGHGPTQYA